MHPTPLLVPSWRDYFPGWRITWASLWAGVVLAAMAERGWLLPLLYGMGILLACGVVLAVLLIVACFVLGGVVWRE
jgi:hypothetical protein